MFSALIRKGETSRLILNERLHLYAPEFIFEEFEKYRDLILKKTHRSQMEFDEVLSIYTERIETIPMEEIIREMEQVKEFSPDVKDDPYLAAAILIGAGLWTNDSKLRDQDVVAIYSTSDLVHMFPDPVNG
ncbi:MAG: PIN domain-containing protein [Candidatus Thermoplasmatota archaeon]|nr:PIN domain-containing protein [Candidatus Thermoplasmatota archaeon]